MFLFFILFDMEKERKSNNHAVSEANPIACDVDDVPSTGCRPMINLRSSLSREAEKKLGAGFQHVIGLDEAGRGPLAGPVVAAACYVTNDFELDGIEDSKQTKQEHREYVYEQMLKAPTKVLFAVCRIENTEIDEINILQASMKAMRVACHELIEKINALHKKTPKMYPCFNEMNTVALVDGNRCPTDMCITPKFVIKGDSCIYSIAAASIIAKVTRDRIMAMYHNEYPLYNFIQHQGYPTLYHRNMVALHGPSPIHRLTYGPVKKYLPAAQVEALEARKKCVASNMKEESKVLEEAENTVSKRKQKKIEGASIVGNKTDVREIIVSKKYDGRGSKKRKVEEIPRRRSQRLKLK